MVLDKASCDLLQYLMDQETSKTIMTISKDLKGQEGKFIITLTKSMLLWVTRRFTSIVFHGLVFT